MSYVQSASSATAGSLSLSLWQVFLANPIKASSCIVVDIIWNPTIGASGVLAVTDVLGNVYTKVATTNGSPTPIIECWIAPNCAGGVSNPYATFVGTGAISDIAMAVHEYANVVAVSPVNVSDGEWASIGPPLFPKSFELTVTTSFSMTTVHAFAGNGAINRNSYPVVLSPPGFTQREIAVNYDGVYSFDTQISVPGTQAVTFSEGTYGTGGPPYPSTFGGIVIALEMIGSPLSPGNAWLYIFEPVHGLTDRSAYLDRSDEGASKHSYTSTLRQRGTAQVPLRVPAGDPYEPEGLIGAPVYAYDLTVAGGSSLVFAGTVSQIDTGWIDDAGDRMVQLTVVSFEQCFDALLIPPRTYYYQSAGAIFASLFSTVCGGVPVTLETAAYAAGSVTATNGATAVTLSGGAWTQAMSGGYVTIQGQQYGMTWNSSTTGTLASPYAGAGGSGLAYILNYVDAPYMEAVVQCNYDKVSDIFTKLATDASCLWGIDLSTLSLYLRAPDTAPAPFAPVSQDIVFGSCKFNIDRTNFRNQQVVRIALSAFADSTATYPGPFHTNTNTVYTLNTEWPIQSVVAAYATNNIVGQAFGRFGGQPSPGDTITVGYPTSGSTYNWQPGAPYSAGQVIVDLNNNIQQCTEGNTSNPPTKFSGSTYPAFSNTPGGTTSDGGIVWTNLRPSGPGGVGASPYTFVGSLVGYTVLLDGLVNGTYATLALAQAAAASAGGIAYPSNAVWGLVLIDPGGSAQQTAQNLVDAMTRNPLTQGQAYSWPTWENPVVNAKVDGAGPSGAGLSVYTKNPGLGYVATVSSTGTAFSWVNSSGAPVTQTYGQNTRENTIALDVAQQGSSNTANLYYTPGSVSFTIPSFPTGAASSYSYIQIIYQRADADCIVCEDTNNVQLLAAAQNGTGEYQALTSDTSNTSNTSGLQECQSALLAFLQVPVQFSFDTYRQGLQQGQAIDLSGITDPVGIASLLAAWGSVLGNVYVVQEVTGSLVPGLGPTASNPTGSLDSLGAPSGWGHYLSTVTVINAAQIFSYLDFWEQGLGGGGGGSTAVIGPQGVSPGGSSTQLSVVISH